MGNLYGDLLKIADGDVAIAEQRVSEFRDFANTVPASSQSGDGQRSGEPAPSGEALYEAAFSTPPSADAAPAEALEDRD